MVCMLQGKLWCLSQGKLLSGSTEPRPKPNKRDVPVHYMKSYMGSGVVAPVIRRYEAKWKWEVRIRPWPLYPQKSRPVPNKWEAGWTPAAVWSFWKEEMFFSMSGFQRRTVQPVAWSINSTTQTRMVSATLDGSYCVWNVLSFTD